MMLILLSRYVKVVQDRFLFSITWSMLMDFYINAAHQKNHQRCQRRECCPNSDRSQSMYYKDIGEWPDHKTCIESAKRICSWLYNSNSLHHMMKKTIGGELVKWNATRFGTNYMS